jgi:asparagine synthase (glutamine-hydrolysing)
MCGIAGFAGTGDHATLRAMTDAIVHRGPDADGYWHDEKEAVFLGFRRLAIVDLVGGAQPMWSADGNTGVVFNGEIYNHLDLRAELQKRGAQFQTDHSDTEVLLHGYREWGDDFVTKLNGMWAFVVYDRARRRLFASRDRFGKKPFYYFHEGATFGFASELAGLLRHPSAPRSISLLSLQKYFAYCYIPAPRSIYERVWKLPAGHSLTFDLASRALTISRYWEYLAEPAESVLPPPTPHAMIVNGSPEIARAGWGDSLADRWCEEIRTVLERAVKRRLMSDVPLGVFLSGGIDSSAIVAFAARHVADGALNTFSIGFNEPSFDESPHARTVAAHFRTQHHEECFDLDKSAALLPDLIARLDEPLGDGSLLPTFLLSRFTRKHVTVALGGDGGDELFAGYDPFQALRAAQAYARVVPKPMHAAIRLIAGWLPVSHANISFDFKIKRTLAGLSYPPKLWNPTWMGAVEPAELGVLFEKKIDIEEIYSEAIAAWDRSPQADLVDRASQFWIDLYLQDGILAKVDRASMLCSLEARSPFLDIEFVDLVRRIPHRFKLRGRVTKWILKRALSPLLPADIVARRKKGFGMPIGRWIREGRFDFDDSHVIDGMNRTFLQKKLEAHRRNRSDERLFLWSYWLLAQWLKR